MSEVKWIKIVTDIFDDEKIRFIETLPEGDTIALLWFRLMCLAGKSNSSGFLMMTEKIPYTDELLASVFNRDVKLVRLALETFERLSMVEIVDNRLYLTNWEKHQSAEAMDKIREQTRIRTQRYRQSLLASGESASRSVTEASQPRHGDDDVTQQNKNKTKSKIEKENKNEGVVRKAKPKPEKVQFSEFVSMTQQEYDKLIDEIGKPATLKAIEILDNYKGSSGTKYASDYHAIRNWTIDRVRKDCPNLFKAPSKPYDRSVNPFDDM